jgi:hypothetical protein
MEKDEITNGIQSEMFTSIVISGFWRRSLAFIIDVLLLFIPTIMLGFLSMGTFNRIFCYNSIFWHTRKFNK